MFLTSMIDPLGYQNGGGKNYAISAKTYVKFVCPHCGETNCWTGEVPSFLIFWKRRFFHVNCSSCKEDVEIAIS